MHDDAYTVAGQFGMSLWMGKNLAERIQEYARLKEQHVPVTLLDQKLDAMLKFAGLAIEDHKVVREWEEENLPDIMERLWSRWEASRGTESSNDA